MSLPAKRSPPRRTRRTLAYALCVVVSFSLPSCTRENPTGKLGRSATPRAACEVGASLPGSTSIGPALKRRLANAWAARDRAYRPRTHHLCAPGKPRYLNRLFLEKSPYLRQHAHNPVDWFPWGPEAFRRARALKRPVLLSVGYSTCHWCHVMERESFEDVEIARLLNQRYVAIKVDREELPAVDATYMKAVQLMRGSGGWPMTVWLTPDRKPFYGATYIPARDGDRGTKRGFLTVLRRLADAYEKNSAGVTEVASKLTRAVRKLLAASTGSKTRGNRPGAEVLHRLMTAYRRRFDGEHGGYRGAPKFPSSLSVGFLLRYQRRAVATRSKGDKANAGRRRGLEMATLTLTRMAAGGLHDQIGGGFHRYSTDSRWLVPHFEKMLYDNALLTLAYLDGYQASGRRRFAEIARRTLDYVRREMTAPGGAFYSATDADSLTPGGERVEGYFFSWTRKEFETVLGPLRGRLARLYWGVTTRGNLDGRNVLHVVLDLPSLAQKVGISERAARTELRAAARQLYRARAKRTPPLRDDKIITAWNGLMISALARGALVLGEPAYARTAAGAARFLLTRLRDDRGRLARRFAAGEARYRATLDDHAFLIAGLLDLFETTGAPRWLKSAIALDRALAAHYEDKKAGGFFLTAADADTLLGRQKTTSDSARPSGNAIQTMNLLRLYQLTDRKPYRLRAERALTAFSGVLSRSPAGAAELVNALDFALDQPKQIVIVDPTSGANASSKALGAVLQRAYLPNRVIVRVRESEVAALFALLPLVENKRALGGKTTAYVCAGGVCKRPTSDPRVFAAQLATTRALPAE